MSFGNQPGPYVSPNAPGGAPGAPIKNWLVEAILATLCCGCWPLGVVAIVFAAQVNGKLANGDRAGAQESANKAKMFVMINVGVGVLVWILAFAFGVLGAVADNM